jgi:hypothetical protein
MMERVREFWFPRLATRRERRLTTVLHACYVCTGASIIWIALAYQRPAPPVVALAVSIGVAINIRLALESAHHRALTRLRNAQFLICPGCLYDLRASVDAGQCPECGSPFDIAGLRHQWTQRYVGLLNRVATRDFKDSDGSDGVDW